MKFIRESDLRKLLAKYGNAITAEQCARELPVTEMKVSTYDVEIKYVKRVEALTEEEAEDRVLDMITAGTLPFDESCVERVDHGHY